MMETLNKKLLAEAIAEKLEMTKKDATVAVETVFEEITSIVAKGGKADIAGFGKFEITNRAARTGVNPSTGEKIQIAASKAPKFKAAKAFKDAVK
ncbi:MAG: HU family DNA-binding protein [Breznakia sp.]